MKEKPSFIRCTDEEVKIQRNTVAQDCVCSWQVVELGFEPRLFKLKKLLHTIYSLKKTEFSKIYQLQAGVKGHPGMQ